MKSGNSYDVIATLGEGTYGTVYQVISVKDGSHFAAKIMKGNTKSASDSYNKEKQIFDKVHRHPHVNLLHCVRFETLLKPKNRWTKNVFLTYVFGPSLHDVQMKARQVPGDPHKTYQRKVFSLDCIKKIGFQLMDGMNHLERLGVYHLDLKPQNILFFDTVVFEFDDLTAMLPQLTIKDHKLKIADYGVARLHEEVTTPGGEFQTLVYRSPEIAMGLPPNKVSDVWSFGMILAELYAGARIFHVDHIQTKKKQEQILYESILAFVEKVPTFELLKTAKLYGYNRVELESIFKNGLSKTESTLKSLKRGAEADELFDVLEKVLVLDQKERPFFKDFFDHPFFLGQEQQRDEN